MPTQRYSIGDVLTVYCGPCEGYTVTVRNFRWRAADRWAPAGWEYDTGLYGWLPEGFLMT